jgi:hypothetical protein
MHVDERERERSCLEGGEVGVAVEAVEALPDPGQGDVFVLARWWGDLADFFGRRAFVESYRKVSRSSLPEASENNNRNASGRLALMLWMPLRLSWHSWMAMTSNQLMISARSR